MTNKMIIVMLSLILTLVLGQTGCITKSLPPQSASQPTASSAPASVKPASLNQDSPASLPVSEKVALSAHSKIDSFYNPKYSSNTQGCLHVSTAFALTEGQNLKLTFESDCPISWDNSESWNNPRPEIGVVFAEMRTFTEESGWFAISSGAKDIKNVSSYDGGRRLDIVLCPARLVGCGFAPPGRGLYKLVVMNLDPDASHYLKYSVDLVPLSAQLAPTPVPEPPSLAPPSTAAVFLETPFEACPGEDITVKARVPKISSYILAITHESYFLDAVIGVTEADSNLIVTWHFTMPYLKAGDYDMKVFLKEEKPVDPAYEEATLTQCLKIKEFVGRLPISILPRSPSQPEIMKQYITPTDPKIKAAVQDILSGSWRWAYDDFEALRQWVCAHVHYRSDSEIHGVGDYWQLPTETLKLSTGDCEDYAILLCTLLRAYGVPSDQVYVALGCSNSGSCHAYLVERYYKGIWRVIDPQAELWTILLLFNSDLYTGLIYKEQCCFNDEDYIDGMPPLPPGTYEFEIGNSMWPVARGAYVEFTRQLLSNELVTGSLEWPKVAGKDQSIVYDWSLNVYDSLGELVYTWSGTKSRHDFSFQATNTGTYTIEILKRDYMPRCARLQVDPPDWKTK
jgi:hypothetical protein